MRQLTEHEQKTTQDCIDRARQKLATYFNEAAFQLQAAAETIGPSIEDEPSGEVKLLIRSLISNLFGTIDEVELVNQMDANNEIRNTQEVADIVADELFLLQMELNKMYV